MFFLTCTFIGLYGLQSILTRPRPKWREECSSEVQSKRGKKACKKSPRFGQWLVYWVACQTLFWLERELTNKHIGKASWMTFIHGLVFVGPRFSRPTPNIEFSVAHTNHHHHHHIDPITFYCNPWMAIREGVTWHLVMCSHVDKSQKPLITGGKR